MKFFSVWTFNSARNDYDCIGVFMNRRQSRHFAASHTSDNGVRPVVLSHPNADHLIDQLLKSRLGVLAEHLARLGDFVGTLSPTQMPKPSDTQFPGGHDSLQNAEP